MALIFGRKEKRSASILAYLIAICVTVMFAVILSSGLISFGQKTDDRAVENLKEILRESLITCYALEGAYPDSLEYLAENYGILLNKEKYIFRYEYIGANIFPEYDVISSKVASGESRSFIYEETDDG